MTTAQDDDDGRAEAMAAGRARVREALLAQLAGLRRPAGVKASDYDALADKLAYMTPDALSGLVEFVLRVAGGAPVPKNPPKCPTPGMIRAWAYALQLPPPQQSDYVASVMRSVLGREARDGLWHVQLFRHLRKFGPPLQMSGWAKDQLRAEAERDSALLARIRERLSAGQQSPDDRAWLARWHDDLRMAESLITEGDSRRAAKAATTTDEGKAA